jgi:hypothetical protein
MQRPGTEEVHQALAGGVEAWTLAGFPVSRAA